MNQPITLFDRINLWIRESIMLKLLSIGFLILILLIPTSWIQSLMEERQLRMEEASSEVANKWAGNQTVSGPILVLPYKYYEQIERDGEVRQIERTEKAYFLPDDLKIKSTVDPKTLNRGIFDVVVYNATVKMEGRFSAPNLTALNIEPDQVVWRDAHLLVGISDLRGIQKDPEIHFGQETLISEPRQDNDGLFPKSIAARVVIDGPADVEKKFTIDVPLKGSGRLLYLPTGKDTRLSVTGNWPNPSFSGAYLPENRSVTSSDFSADWNVLHFNRPFPQQWTKNSTQLYEAAFGVDLLMPVDQYQKSIRTAKYGVLVIMLTFIALFFIEIICKLRIHPFQYILIGSALIIYYSLQLALSEHIGFDLGYLIASAATVSLIGAYSFSFLPNNRIVSLLSLLLVIFYTFVYTITQLQDYALLLGSIGLFVIIGVLMWLSRKISWYQQGNQKVEIT